MALKQVSFQQNSVQSIATGMLVRECPICFFYRKIRIINCAVITLRNMVSGYTVA